VPSWHIVEYSIGIDTEASLTARTVSEITAARSMVKLRNYLRVYRRQWYLTQEELAFLLGYEAESFISRLERDERAITLAVASACQALFGVKLGELFPAPMEGVQKSLVVRMQELSDRLQQSEPTPKTVSKLELLQEALARLAESPERQEV
jgi:transcriptional regulator with XRE-family HTH domain